GNDVGHAVGVAGVASRRCAAPRRLIAQTVVVFNVWLGFNPLAYTAISGTEQLLLLGWLTQLGLALLYNQWVPDHKVTTPAAFTLFNLGLPAALLGQPGIIRFGGEWLGILAASGALLQLIAGVLVSIDVWRHLFSR
ncbi:MAG: hypothetical protein AAF485_26485, partial [Chloroflexota bacterium]